MIVSLLYYLSSFLMFSLVRLAFVCVVLVFLSYVIFFFFFKQKTAYEMRISDWSSDVCSSDLFTTVVDDGLHAFEHAYLQMKLPTLITARRRDANTFTVQPKMPGRPIAPAYSAA